MLFWIPQTNTINIVPLKIAPKKGEFAESATVFAESRTVCGIHKQMIQLAIFAKRNQQQNKCADKIYVTGICLWNPLTFGNIFKDLSRESRNIQTQNCAPIQCTVWPRNGSTPNNTDSGFRAPAKSEHTSKCERSVDIYQLAPCTAQASHIGCVDPILNIVCCLGPR